MSDDKPYEVGYGKPPKSKQFGQPDGPIPGKTKGQRKAEIEAAEIAAKVSLELVKAISETIENASSEEKVEKIRSDVLRLLKDVQDRAHGTPKQTVEQTVEAKVSKGTDDFYAAVAKDASGDLEGE